MRKEGNIFIAQLISIQLLHTIRHFYGRFMLGHQKKCKSKSKPSENVDFQSSIQPL